MATFFFDQDLNLISRLNNFSTGCGTWLEDGRFIAFGQRNAQIMEEFDAGILRADMVSYDITTVIDPPAPITYEGEAADGSKTATWTSSSADGLLLIFHRDPADETTMDHFLRAELDEKELSPENYIAEAGSLRITLKPSYLETLAEGMHTLRAVFDDGEAEITFQILKQDNTPSTGDQNQPTLWITLMIMALLVAAVAILTAMTKRIG